VFSAFLAYQLVDLLIALALAALAVRLTEARGDRLAARFPRALATPFRRLALIALPAFALLLFAFAIAGRLWLFPSIGEALRSRPVLQRAANVGVFLVLGVTYLGVLVVFPLLGVLRAWREPASDVAAIARRTVDRRVASVALVAAVALVAYASYVEPNRLVVERTPIALHGWPANKPPLRVALIADVQSALLGDRERRVTEKIGALRPDLILVAGDLVAQSFDESLPLAQAHFVLSHLHAPLGVFVVNGDVDDVVDGGIRRIVEGTGARLLENESVLLESDPPVELAGLDPRDEATAERLLHAPALSPLRIGLVHRPRHWAELSAAGFPLVLAGHTHGGQVVVPGFGPLMTFEVVAREVCGGGLHAMRGGTQLYVTRGVGCEGGFAPPIRFLCPPEISLLEIGPGSPAPAAITNR
jgi:predicted MPP superfamily phosphohydrolase